MYNNLNKSIYNNGGNTLNIIMPILCSVYFTVAITYELKKKKHTP